MAEIMTSEFATPFQREVIGSMQLRVRATAPDIAEGLGRRPRAVVNALCVLRGLSIVEQVKGEPGQWALVSEHGRPASEYERTHFKRYDDA